MNQEQINQVMETIKTLNLNVDSNTALQITQEVKPLVIQYMWMSFTTELIGMFIITGFVLASFYVCYKVMEHN